MCAKCLNKVGTRCSEICTLKKYRFGFGEGYLSEEIEFNLKSDRLSAVRKIKGIRKAENSRHLTVSAKPGTE